MFALLKTIRRGVLTALYSPFIIKDYFAFSRRDKNPRFTYSWRTFYPQIFDKTKLTGFDRHYVYHTAWAARKVAEHMPKVHIDIASSLYFPGIVSAFVPVEFYDYRPAPLQLSKLTTKHADLTKLHFEDSSVTSLSCMHTIEHIGLGRYGDPIDPDSDIKACDELSRVLAPGGQLIFVTPVGKKAVIEFNAHRIYTYERVLELFPKLILKEFSFIEERGTGGIIEHASPLGLQAERYACGCFIFTK
jgi:SAM-dependent methyltransferase